MVKRSPASMQMEGVIRGSEQTYGPSIGDWTYEHKVVCIDRFGRQFEMELLEIRRNGEDPTFQMGMHVVVTVVEKTDDDMPPPPRQIRDSLGVQYGNNNVQSNTWTG
jgi:hypothetical protein